MSPSKKRLTEPQKPECQEEEGPVKRWIPRLRDAWTLAGAALGRASCQKRLEGMWAADSSLPAARPEASALSRNSVLLLLFTYAATSAASFIVFYSQFDHLWRDLEHFAVENWQSLRVYGGVLVTENIAFSFSAICVIAGALFALLGLFTYCLAPGRALSRAVLIAASCGTISAWRALPLGILTTILIVKIGAGQWFSKYSGIAPIAIMTLYIGYAPLLSWGNRRLVKRLELRTRVFSRDFFVFCVTALTLTTQLALLYLGVPSNGMKRILSPNFGVELMAASLDPISDRNPKEGFLRMNFQNRSTMDWFLIPGTICIKILANSEVMFEAQGDIEGNDLVVLKARSGTIVTAKVPLDEVHLHDAGFAAAPQIGLADVAAPAFTGGNQDRLRIRNITVSIQAVFRRPDLATIRMEKVAALPIAYPD